MSAAEHADAILMAAFEHEWDRERTAILAAVQAAMDDGPEWRTMDSAPVAEPFLAGVYVTNNKTGQRWWESHVVWVDDETGEINSDTEAGWSIRDYSHWRPLPTPPKEPNHD